MQQNACAGHKWTPMLLDVGLAQWTKSQAGLYIAWNPKWRNTCGTCVSYLNMSFLTLADQARSTFGTGCRYTSGRVANLLAYLQKCTQRLFGLTC